MLVHVSLLKWAEGATPEQRAAVEAGLARLPAQIPEIRSYRFGADAGLSPANHDLAIVAGFDDAEGYRRYAEHPAHRELIARLVRPILAGRAAVQFEPPPGGG